MVTAGTSGGSKGRTGPGSGLKVSAVRGPLGVGELSWVTVRVMSIRVRTGWVSRRSSSGGRRTAREMVEKRRRSREERERRLIDPAEGVMVAIGERDHAVAETEKRR